MRQTFSKAILILAYGNLSRGDDALAPLLLDELQNLPAPLLENVDCLTDFQLQIEHALDLEKRELVLFMDASIANQHPVEFSQLQAQKESSYTTHALHPTAVMQVYQEIHKSLPPPCFLLTLQAVEFELGSGLSAVAQASLIQAEYFIKTLLNNPTLSAWQSYTLNRHSL